ncbi:MAG: M48 family metalloprotease, partial [Mangrovicoccus sp.]
MTYRSIILSVLVSLALAACAPSVPGPVVVGVPAPSKSSQSSGSSARGVTPAQYRQVVAEIMPVARGICAATPPQKRCDFQALLDPRRGVAANAYQTVTSSGQPVIIVTAELLRSLANTDELALVVSHEAAHHIRDHLKRRQQSEVTYAVIAGLGAQAVGASREAIVEAQRQAAYVGGRLYSPDYELEADRLGAQIAKQAGYNPINGVRYFTRAPDPGDRFLATHPPNKSRIQAVT